MAGDEATIKIILQDASKSSGGGGGSAPSAGGGGGSGAGGGGRRSARSTSPESARQSEIDSILAQLQAIEDAEVAKVARRNKEQGAKIAREMESLGEGELQAAKDRAKEIAQDQKKQAEEDKRRLRAVADAYKAGQVEKAEIHQRGMEEVMAFGPQKGELQAGKKRTDELAREQREQAKEYARDADIARRDEDNWIKELMAADKERAKEQKAQAKEYARDVDVARQTEDDWIKELMRADKEKAKEQKAQAKDYARDVDVTRKGEDNYIKELMKADKEKEKERRKAEAKDPYFQARKRREGQRRGALVNDAYKRMYGETGKDSAGDQVLKVVDGLRGTIGGLFGTVVGATVDVWSAVRKQQKEGEREGLRRQLLDEAGGGRGRKPGKGSGVPGGGPPGPGAEGDPDRGGAAGEDALAAEGAAVGGAAVAAVTVAAVVAVVAVFREAAKALDKAADKYGEYDPAIARAQQEAEVRTVLGDIRRGQEMSSDLVKYLESRTNMEQSWEDAKVEMLKAIAPAVTQIMEIIAEIGQAVTVLMKIATFWRDKEVAANVLDPTDILLRDIRFTNDAPRETSFVPQV